MLAIDGAPPWPAPGVHPAGNLVVVETGGVQVFLAHLEPGSIVVRRGDPVQAGDPVGRVGCTGNSTEPHLHVHAVRGDVPVPMRYDAVRGGYRRGSVLRCRLQGEV